MYRRAGVDDLLLMIEDRFEDYVVEGKLGTGGLATVYRVRHAETDEPFALKVLDRPSEVDIARLKREARVQGMVKHPNVVVVHRIIELDDTFALVMDLVDGPTLRELLEERGPLAPEQLNDLADSMLAGLAAVHRHGVVHRDLKPSNILLQPLGPTFVPRLTDFGMVRVMQDTDTRLTSRFATLGTPMYVAPEQLTNSRDIDQTADIYAIGCVLFEMAAGRPPVQVRGLVDLFDKVTRGKREHIQDAAPDLPLRMQRCIERCLSLEPVGRYGDGEELRRAWMGFSQSELSNTSFYAFDEASAPTTRILPPADDEEELVWEEGPSWQDTTRIISRLTRREGRRELVETVENQLPVGRNRFQQRVIRALAAMVVFGGIALVIGVGLIVVALFVLVTVQLVR